MGDWDNLDAEEDAEFQRRAEALILASSEVEEKFDRGGILSKMFPCRYQEEAEALQIASDQLQADQREARRRRQARQAQEE